MAKIDCSTLLTTLDLAKLFGVTPLTISNWRNREGLPVVRIPGASRDAIRFVPASVKAWARKTGHAFV